LAARMISRACIKRSISARPASALGRAPSPPSQFQGYGHPSSCGTTLSRHLMASSPLETRSTGTVLSTSLCARWVLRRTAVRLFVSVSGRLFDNRVLCCIWAGPRTRWAQDASKPMLLPSLRDALLASARAARGINTRIVLSSHQVNAHARGCRCVVAR